MKGVTPVSPLLRITVAPGGSLSTEISSVSPWRILAHAAKPRPIDNRIGIAARIVNRMSIDRRKATHAPTGDGTLRFQDTQVCPGLDSRTMVYAAFSSIAVSSRVARG